MFLATSFSEMFLSIFFWDYFFLRNFSSSEMTESFLESFSQLLSRKSFSAFFWDCFFLINFSLSFSPGPKNISQLLSQKRFSAFFLGLFLSHKLFFIIFCRNDSKFTRKFPTASFSEELLSIFLGLFLSQKLFFVIFFGTFCRHANFPENSFFPELSTDSYFWWIFCWMLVTYYHHKYHQWMIAAAVVGSVS